MGEIVFSKGVVTETAPPVNTPPEGKVDHLPSTDAQTTVPLSAYASAKGMPYGAVYFGLADCWAEMESLGLADQLHFIERYANETIKRTGMADVTQSFKEVIDHVKKTLNLDEKMPFNKLISRVHDYAKVMTDIADARKRMDKLMHDVLKTRLQ